MAFIWELIKSIFYGLIQGITEWIPISSTGHLILLHTVMPLNVYGDPAADLAFWNMYKVVIQLGSILAVTVVFWKRLFPFSAKKTEAKKKAIYRIWYLIAIASIPVAILGFLLDDIVDEMLSTPFVVAIALIIYGLIFLIVEVSPRKPLVNSVAEITPKQAVLVGLSESLALIPGTSRSGSTIIGGRLLGFSRPVATEFSFFLAIPVMFGASVLKLIKMKVPLNTAGIVILLAGMLTSFLVSDFVIQSLMRYIRKNDFKLFGLYRIVLGIMILILAFLGILPMGLSA